MTFAKIRLVIGETTMTETDKKAVDVSLPETTITLYTSRGYQTLVFQDKVMVDKRDATDQEIAEFNQKNQRD